MRDKYEILDEIKDAEVRVEQLRGEFSMASARGWRAEAIERLGGRIEPEYPRAVRVDDDQLYLASHHISLGAGGCLERQLEILDFCREIIRRRIAGEDI